MRSITLASTILFALAACVGDDPVPSSASPTSGADAGGGEAGASSQACAPTDRTCVGAEMRGCNAEGTGFSVEPLEVCASPALCTSGLAGGRCTPPACAADETMCVGSERHTCLADRTAFVKTETCSGAKPACAAGACVECSNDAVSCEGKVPRTCTANAWQAGTACAGTIGASCSGGACVDVRTARWPMPNDSGSAIRPIKYTVVSPSVVRDEVTKLEWQRGVSPGPIDVAGGARRVYCETLDLDGERGWHLPSAVELLTLVDYAKTAAPRLDTTTFTGTPTGVAAAGLVGGEATAASPRVNYDTGSIQSESIAGGSYHVRCVRSTVAPPIAARFTNNAGEVTDAYTKLVWKAAPESGYKTQTAALTACAAPWRLPSAKELYTLLDPSLAAAPYCDAALCSGASADTFWTSTSSPADPTKKIVIDFTSPIGIFGAGPFDAKVRCVK